MREARGTAKLWDGLLHEEVPMADFSPAELAPAMNQALATVARKAATELAAAAQALAATPVVVPEPTAVPAQ